MKPKISPLPKRTHEHKNLLKMTTTHLPHIHVKQRQPQKRSEQNRKKAMIPIFPKHQKYPPEQRNPLAKHVKITLNKEPPNPQYINMLSQAAREEGLLKSELSSVLVHKLEHPHARTRTPHHLPIPAGLGFDIDDYVHFTAPARKQKNSIITRHFVGENASIVITFTARNDPTLFPAPYAFQTSMMSTNLINQCDLDILRRNLKHGNNQVIPIHNISTTAHQHILDFLNKQEEWAAHTAVFLAIESIASYCKNENSTTRNRANRIPLSPIKRNLVICNKCKKSLEEYHSNFPFLSFINCQWAVTPSSFSQDLRLQTPNNQLLLCPRCASDHAHVLDNVPCIWAPPGFIRESYQPTYIGGVDTRQRTTLEKWVTMIPSDYLTYHHLKNKHFVSPIDPLTPHLSYDTMRRNTCPHKRKARQNKLPS
jgi:hypothetical protein